MAARGEIHQVQQARAVQDIAKARFAFPNGKYPHYKTYVNRPQPSMGIRLPTGGAAYPDIVVVEDPENHTKMLAQVETAETVNEEQAQREWKPLADLGPLYLYVPVGYADEAKRICKKLRIPIVGLRTWRHILGYQEIEIVDIFTRWAGPEDLLPRPLRAIARKLL